MRGSHLNLDLNVHGPAQAGVAMGLARLAGTQLPEWGLQFQTFMVRWSPANRSGYHDLQLNMTSAVFVLHWYSTACSGVPASTVPAAFTCQAVHHRLLAQF
jgi:hypothetical protein